MSDPASSHRQLLDIIPLATRLDRQDLAVLAQQYPEFNVDMLLEHASVMGDGSTPPDATEAVRLRTTQFELQLAVLAIARVLPKCESAWHTIGGKLRAAGRTELYASFLTLFGSGSAAGGAALSEYVPALIGAVIAVLASAMSLQSQFQRRALREDVSLTAVYATLCEARGLMLQLRDELQLWRSEPEAMLVSNEQRVSDAAKRALELTAKIEEAVSSAGL